VIKASGSINGKPFMLIGLSEENVTRLAAGEPILFDGAPFGYNGNVIVTYGRTEDDIRAELQRHGLAPGGERP
jgi:hypothetical protein